MPSGDRDQVQREPHSLVGQAASLLVMVAVVLADPWEAVMGRQERAGSEPAPVQASMAAEKAAPKHCACVAAALPHHCVWGVDPEPRAARMPTGSAPADAGGRL